MTTEKKSTKGKAIEAVPVLRTDPSEIVRAMYESLERLRAYRNSGNSGQFNTELKMINGVGKISNAIFREEDRKFRSVKLGLEYNKPQVIRQLLGDNQADKLLRLPEELQSKKNNRS
jgi:hypothetical protein